jgi:hypothetical protein
MNLNFLDIFFKKKKKKGQMSNFIEIRKVGIELFVPWR